MTREDAIKTLYELRRETNDTWYEEVYNMAIEALQREEAEEKGYCHRIKPKEYLSADAVPTVIRSKTLMPTKDFKVWAKRIREENPNAVIIPCDAEVVSADSVVRCKDCKYSFYDKDYESYNCRKHEYVECFDADDYCSWGERND